MKRKASESIPVGHLQVHLADDSHPPDLEFGFERQSEHVSGAVGASLLAHIVFVGLILVLLRFSEPVPAPVEEPLPLDGIVWLAEPGPGGGGGGGGNESPEPPRPVELPGEDELTVPVEEPVEIEQLVEEPPDEEPLEALNIPAQTLTASLNPVPVTGSIQGIGPSTSLGLGRGGGAGTGEGTGIGPGQGSGLGPGSGGGTGGGVYRPGNGVESPRVLREAKPQYTADAMRAKIQGRVMVECVVGLDGRCSRVEIVRSLDPVFGLDEEAIKAVRQWRFVPGRRQGEDVPVLVNIELTFTLR